MSTCILTVQVYSQLGAQRQAVTIYICHDFGCTGGGSTGVRLQRRSGKHPGGWRRLRPTPLGLWSAAPCRACARTAARSERADGETRESGCWLSKGHLFLFVFIFIFLRRKHRVMAAAAGNTHSSKRQEIFSLCILGSHGAKEQEVE